jgi:hypothetical protein
MKGDFIAKNTGTSSRGGSVKDRTQKQFRTRQWLKRDEEKVVRNEANSKLKENGQPFKGVAKEPDKRRRQS